MNDQSIKSAARRLAREIEARFRRVALRPGRAGDAVRWVARKLRGLWDALPGPTWVKVALLVGCLLIPGPGDEIALVAIAGALAVRKARRSR